MVLISNFYICYFTRPINFTFIEYDNFIKVILNYRSIIITKEHLISNIKLYEIYKLSLLYNIKDNKYYNKELKKYYISTKMSVMTNKKIYIPDDYKLIALQKSFNKNPLNMKEPNRETSMKKIRKFLKLLEFLYKK